MSVFAECIHRLELFLKKIITIRQRKNFICDSHPAICRVCVNVRSLLRHGKTPRFCAITTRKGVFIYFKFKQLVFQIFPRKGQPNGNFAPVYGMKLVLPWKVFYSRELPVLFRQVFYFPLKKTEKNS